ncbi:MAG TPA: hypothetical protein VEC19_09385 [Usitatibacter sp.]|nr:hypothetical protein [Usitatibacter sp.]
MSSAARQGRQGLVSAWLAQMIGTVVLAAVVLAYVRSAGAPFGAGDVDWKRYAMIGILAGAAPALLYLRTFKRRLNAYEATANREGDNGDPALRVALMKALAIGGAMCELPMAMGVVQLFFGGETRWFLGATLVTIALRLSYRPFQRVS